MDNISNLSSNLPPTKPVSEEALKELEADLALEFKNAAKSVASLYKLSLQKQSMLKYKGYLDCIDDLLNIIKNDGDVENWALMKKLELEGKLTNEQDQSSNTTDKPQKHNTSDSTSTTQDLNLSDHDFTISYPTHHKFPPTMPLLSVDHHNHRNNMNPTTRSHLKSSGHDDHNKILTTQTNHTMDQKSSQMNENEDIDIIDDSTSKRKLQSVRMDKRIKH